MRADPPGPIAARSQQPALAAFPAHAPPTPHAVCTSWRAILGHAPPPRPAAPPLPRRPAWGHVLRVVACHPEYTPKSVTLPPGILPHAIHTAPHSHLGRKCTQYTTETLPVKHRLKIVYTSYTPFLRRQHSKRASAVTDSSVTDSAATDNTRSPDPPPHGVGVGGKGDLSAGGGIPATRQGSMRLPHEARAQSAQTGSPTRTKIPYR